MSTAAARAATSSAVQGPPPPRSATSGNVVPGSCSSDDAFNVPDASLSWSLLESTLSLGSAVPVPMVGRRAFS
eukprot:CAMPEP_0118989260 /NCGR_PEP_ID=MMETSP1173-20130426/47684_1 /TAXON_ID=1034831 /ORGANISM="Rhizochromulina marina cf, Strain CCMP1243" /LENGTH=72 /DNA_ID=CAMNT_0006940241 /DNA_START=207 /DNA_END=422 /DNA_ORIENTATION=+